MPGVQCDADRHQLKIEGMGPCTQPLQTLQVSRARKCSSLEQLHTL